jgi:hypothetical protein
LVWIKGISFVVNVFGRAVDDVYKMCHNTKKAFPIIGEGFSPQGFGETGLLRFWIV